jgi:hypothetical protein
MARIEEIAAVAFGRPPRRLLMLAAPQTPLLRTYLGRPLAIASVRRIISTELDALANQHPERDLDCEPSDDDGPH